jgi:hypothetical protein
MNTNAESVSRAVSELYISKINSLIAAGHESLVASVVAEYDRADREASKAVEQAA